MLHPDIHFLCVSRGIVVHKLWLFYLFSLLQVGHHDNRSCVLLPDHPPEVIYGFLLWPWERWQIRQKEFREQAIRGRISSTNTDTNITLSCDKFILLLVTLKKRRRKVDIKRRVHQIESIISLLCRRAKLIIQTFIKEALMKSESGTPSRGKRWTLEWSSDSEMGHRDYLMTRWRL